MVRLRGSAKFLFPLVTLVVLALFSFGGCGGERDATTGPISTSTQGDTTPSTGVTVDVYFLRGEEPVPVVREVEGGGAAKALGQLLEGPTASEEAEGTTTAIPEGTRLNSYNVDGHEAKVDFSSELLNYGGGSAIVLAITDQITKTVLSSDLRVSKVYITIEGVPADEALQP